LSKSVREFPGKCFRDFSGMSIRVFHPLPLDKLYHCTTRRSDVLLEDCFEVKYGAKLLNVAGCNIDLNNYNFKELSPLGKSSTTKQF